jgi:uncharacterized membrane protein
MTPAVPLWATRGVSAVVFILIAIGVAAAVGRVLFPEDMIQRAEPMRTDFLKAWDREDPLALQRPAEIARMDRPFAEHRWLTLAHVVPGALFFVFAPLQFSSRLRARYLNLHRWSGRILLCVVTVSLLPGLFFGIVMPFGGPAEAVTIAAIGIFFLYAMATAFIAIRRGAVRRHREWMIRMFAIALAISTVRLIGGPLDFVLTPYGIPPPDLFVLSIWTAWLLTIVGAECWIRYTRERENGRLRSR